MSSINKATSTKISEREDYDEVGKNIFSDFDRKMKMDAFHNLIIYTEDQDVISQSIKNILATPRGTRVRYPEFGTKLRKFLFELIDDDMIDEIKIDIREAIETWENRVRVKGVRVELIDHDNNTIDLEIKYYIKHKGKLEKFRGRIAPPE